MVAGARLPRPGELERRRRVRPLREGAGDRRRRRDRGGLVLDPRAARDAEARGRPPERRRRRRARCSSAPAPPRSTAAASSPSTSPGSSSRTRGRCRTAATTSPPNAASAVAEPLIFGLLGAAFASQVGWDELGYGIALTVGDGVPRRPLVAAAGTVGSGLTRGERAPRLLGRPQGRRAAAPRRLPGARPPRRRGAGGGNRARRDRRLDPPPGRDARPRSRGRTGGRPGRSPGAHRDSESRRRGRCRRTRRSSRSARALPRCPAGPGP